MKIHVILEPDITPDQLVEIGLLAESLDIAGLWVQNYAVGADPFMSLVPLARESSRIRLGVVIVSPYETHPAKMATSLLTLNEYSKGRASIPQTSKLIFSRPRVSARCRAVFSMLGT